MTRNEHLEFCKKCLNRKFDPKQGVICNLTGKIADFEVNCTDFKQDETVKEKIDENSKLSREEIITGLDNEAITRLKIYQDFYYAIAGGLLAALLGAVIWAVVTVATQHQIGYMAIGVGLLVGFSVQFFGAGIDKKFGYLGAVLSLLGCLLGNLFSQVGFIAQAQSLDYFDTLTYLNFNLIISIIAESFAPIDLLFYGLAGYEGYRFAFRRVSAGDLVRLKSGKYEGYPSNYKLRMPLVVGSIVILGLFSLKLSWGANGFKTFQYESGKKMSEGEMKNSKEHGKWISWYENGMKQSIGFYFNGLPDSSWQWFDETGRITKIGYYKKGLEHGVWMDYYKNGTVSDSGSYVEGRRSGLWKSWYEDGNILQTGYYKRNLQDSIWQTYFENGQLNTVGTMINGNPSGTWITYYEHGQLASQVTHESNKLIIENVWNSDGSQMVVNGNGFYRLFSGTGVVIQSGMVEKGFKVGKWTTFYENGNRKEEGKYDNEIYQILNSWEPNGNQNVTKGTGTYINYYPNKGSVLETGDVINGFREGIWKMFYESTGTLFMEQHYKKGKLTGPQKIYFETGQLYSAGEVTDGLREGKWTWYYENGNISSSVDFSGDKKDGKQIMWSETGEKTKEEYYETGELIKEKTFYTE